MVEHIGDLELTPSGGREVGDDIERIRSQEIDANRDEITLRHGGLLFKPEDCAVRPEFGDTETLGIGDPVEHGSGTPRAFFERRRDVGQSRPAENVVPENDAEGVVTDEVPGEADRVGDAESPALIPVRQIEAEVGPISQQLHDVTDTLAADDDHDLPNAHSRERLERVVDHRPVVDRQEVLVRDDREREQSGGGAASEDEAFHRVEAYQPPGRFHVSAARVFRDVGGPVPRTTGHARMLPWRHASGPTTNSMTSGIYGLRRLGEPGFRPIVLVLVAVILVAFRGVQFAVFSTQIQWGYDFSAYWTAAGNLLHGLPIYVADQLTGPYAPQRQFLYLYPPPLAAAVTPIHLLIPTDYRVAAWIWAAFGTIVLATGTFTVARSTGLIERVRGATGLGPWILIVAAFTFPPVVGELVLGNVHLLLFGLLSMAWLGVRRGDRTGEAMSGVAVGLAAAIKLFPVLLILWFLFTGRNRAVKWAILGGLAVVILSLPLTGIQPWLDYPAALLNLSAPSDTTDTLAPTVWLASAIGFTAARAIVTLGALALLWWSARTLRSRPSFAVAVLLSVLVAPALYHHYLAILVLPFLLLLPERGQLRWLALAYLLMSGGEQTALGDWSWIVNRGLPTAGALILLIVALRPSHTELGGDPSANASRRSLEEAPLPLA